MLRETRRHSAKENRLAVPAARRDQAHEPFNSLQVQSLVSYSPAPHIWLRFSMAA